MFILQQINPLGDILESLDNRINRVKERNQDNPVVNPKPEQTQLALATPSTGLGGLDGFVPSSSTVAEGSAVFNRKFEPTRNLKIVNARATNLVTNLDPAKIRTLADSMEGTANTLQNAQSKIKTAQELKDAHRHASLISKSKYAERAIELHNDLQAATTKYGPAVQDLTPKLTGELDEATKLANETSKALKDAKIAGIKEALPKAREATQQVTNATKQGLSHADETAQGLRNLADKADEIKNAAKVTAASTAEKIGENVATKPGYFSRACSWLGSWVPTTAISKAYEGSKLQAVANWGSALGTKIMQAPYVGAALTKCGQALPAIRAGLGIGLSRTFAVWGAVETARDFFKDFHKKDYVALAVRGALVGVAIAAAVLLAPVGAPVLGIVFAAMSAAAIASLVTTYVAAPAFKGIVSGAKWAGGKISEYGQAIKDDVTGKNAPKAELVK